MDIIKITTRLTNEEKETHISYSASDRTWYMDSTIQKHFNKALKQGWTPTVKYEYTDGSVAGYILKASERAITIRSVEKKKMSDIQMNNLSSQE